jgi:hypothetical protein
VDVDGAARGLCEQRCRQNKTAENQFETMHSADSSGATKGNGGTMP